MRLLRILAASALLTLFLAACTSTSTTTSAPPETTPPPIIATTVPATTTSALATTTSTAPATTTTSQSVIEEATVLLSPDGLIFEGPSSQVGLPFGSPQAEVIEAVEGALGPATDAFAGMAECPNGVDWVTVWETISIDFSDGQFLSWSLSPESPLTDEFGIGLGSTLADIENNYESVVFESSLGPEFLTAPDFPAMGGLLSDSSDTAIVTNLWAGLICAFR